MKVRYVVIWMILLVAVLGTAPVLAGGIQWSALDRPDRPGPVFISAGPTYGGSPDWDAGTIGFNASILFRPARAADFSPALFHWNTGVVIDGEWRRLAERRDILTADLILRRYMADLGSGDGRAVLFAGFGGGLALMSYPSTTTSEAAEGGTPVTSVTRAEQRWWSTVVEFGYEAEPTPDVVVTVKGRWRSYIKRPFDYSSWTIHVQAGIPIPW